MICKSKLQFTISLVNLGHYTFTFVKRFTPFHWATNAEHIITSILVQFGCRVSIYNHFTRFPSFKHFVRICLTCNITNMEKGKCQSLYYNLLMLLDFETVSSPHYLREFFQTEHCDAFTDLKSAREAVIQHVTSGVWKRIENMQDDHEDDALQTMVYYQSLLLSSLSWKNHIYFRVIYQPWKALASFGFVSMGYGGVRGAIKAYRQKE